MYSCMSAVHTSFTEYLDLASQKATRSGFNPKKSSKTEEEPGMGDDAMESSYHEKSKVFFYQYFFILIRWNNAQID